MKTISQSFCLGFSILLTCSVIAGAQTIYVGSGNNGQIIQYNSGGSGSFFANLGLVTGMAYNGGNLYAASQGSNDIVKYNSSGQGTVFASSGILVPNAIAFNTSGNLFLANFKSNNILEFNSLGQSSVFASGFQSLYNYNL
jgi:hypothetical protein